MYNFKLITLKKIKLVFTNRMAPKTVFHNIKTKSIACILNLKKNIISQKIIQNFYKLRCKIFNSYHLTLNWRKFDREKAYNKHIVD